MNATKYAVCDLHCDTVWPIRGGADFVGGDAELHLDLPRLRRGGVALQVFACFIPTAISHGSAFDTTVALLDQLDATVAASGGALARVETAGDAERARAQGQVGVMAAVENGHAIENDPDRLETLRRRGVRYMTLTHSRHLDWAASSGEPWSGDAGLTAMGSEIVRRMNDLGIVVDVSHVHERTFWDVVRRCAKPFIASHSCAAAVCPSARNLTDDQLRAIAGAGGMVGINFFPGFLDSRYFAGRGEALGQLFAEVERVERDCADDPARLRVEMARLNGALRARCGPPEADIDTVADHVLHIVRLVGDECVGFGSDFDGVPDLPRGVGDAAAYPALLERLERRGLSEASIRKIAWGNFLRVLRDNE